MSQPDSRLLLEVLRLRLGKSLKKELARDDDERRALRKSLLGLILMTRDGSSAAAKDFGDYLLKEFPALADQFSRTHDHPLFGTHTVGRRVSADEGLVLALEKELVGSMLRKPLSARELALVGSSVPWDVTAPRYVGFFDIMGFRQLVKRHNDDHEVLHGMMREFHNISIRAQEMHPHGGGKLHPALDHPGSQLRVVAFSDAILALTRDASATSSLLIQLVSQMFFLHALRLGTALRGAIARGTVTADFERSIFFGQPVVDAYLLEEDQAWYGIVEHFSMEADVSELTGEIRPITQDEAPLTLQHKVPLKSVGATRMSVINWPVMCGDLEGADDLLRHLRSDSEKLNTYYQSTREFARISLGNTRFKKSKARPAY
jgi:hypothetical protein